MNFIRRNHPRFLLVNYLLALCLSSSVLARQLENAAYVGAEVCGSCHQQQEQLWQQSDHHKAMQVAKPETVLGDFSDLTVTFHGIASRLYRQDKRYWVDTVDGSAAKKTFEIKYTFGFEPLQQYLIETDDGHIQAFNIAWDSRSKAQGGQRWFHLQPDENITPEHPFFWTRYFQNWNMRCASCHSTNIEKNYNAETHSYNTTWSAINVSCEACHGAGAKHINLAQSNKLSSKNTGFAWSSVQPLRWEFKPGEAIATPKGEKNNQQITT